MSETRGIKVDSCWGCPLHGSCLLGPRIIAERGIPIKCPLPKWPSVTEKEKEILLGVIDMGISEYMPIAEYKCPGKILKEKLKSILDNLEVTDAG